jgi:hypothetical protein
MRFWRHARGGLTIATTAVLLQACASQGPQAPGTRVFASDLAGAAKACTVPKVAPAAGKQTPVAMQVGNDGGWCGITVSDGGKPFSAGLLTAEPMHGKVLIHTVGDNTRIDYTPDVQYAGADSFVVRLIPGDATLATSVVVARP